MSPAPRRTPGRPRSVMTTDAEAAILRAVRLGVWPDRAATMNGIPSATLRAHRRRNKAFATALESAEAEAESAIHGKILRHMDKQWTAAAWMLERRWPSRWAKREPEVAVSVTAEQAPAQVTVVGPPIPSIDAWADQTAKMAVAARELAERAKQIDEPENPSPED